MLFYYIVVRMPLAYLLSRLGFGLNGIWVAILVSHVVASVAAGVSGPGRSKKDEFSSKQRCLFDQLQPQSRHSRRLRANPQMIAAVPKVGQ